MDPDPAKLRIVQYPDPILRTRARTVPEIDDHARAVADRMVQLMFEAEGIGLAAPQVGLPWRLFVAHVPEGDDRSAAASPASATTGPLVCFDPVLSDPRGEPAIREEGCLSLPDIHGDVIRPPVITLTAADAQGRRFSLTADGLLARCFQHEFDHIEGILILDRMTQMSRLKNRPAIRAMEKQAGLR